MRPTSTERLGWSVHKRRLFEAARAARRRDDHTDMIIRLKVIFDLQTPEGWRESLSADLPSLTARCRPWEQRKWMPFRAAHWIINTVWEKLPAEKNPKVRCSLLRLGARLITRPPFTYSERTRDAVATDAMLQVLEQELTTPERQRAFGLLLEILDWGGADSVQTGIRVLTVCLRTIVDHCTASAHSSKEMRRLAACMRYAVLATNSIDIILADEHALPFIFEGIRCAEGRLHRSLSSLLATILECTWPPERTTLIVRHYTQLKQAFHLMWLRDLVDFAYHPEFAAIIATTPTLLDLVWRRTQHDCRWHRDDCWAKFGYDDVCQIATYVLESALDDDSRLQSLLGYGFLSVAGHFASNSYDHSSRRVEIFRQILAKHPEWTRRFRAMTAHGVEGNLTAEMGRALIDKPRKAGKDYILQEEDGQL